jgi:hypothetical protein
MAEPIEFDFLLHRNHILNANKGYKHWSVRSEKVAIIRTYGMAQGRKLPKYRRVRMHVRVSYPDWRVRDVNNLQPTMKAFVDGLVDKGKGILPDDSDAFFEGPFMVASGQLSPKAHHFLFRVRLEPLATAL